MNDTQSTNEESLGSSAVTYQFVWGHLFLGNANATYNINVMQYIKLKYIMMLHLIVS